MSNDSGGRMALALPHISRRENSANKIIHTALRSESFSASCFSEKRLPFIKAAVDKTRVEVYLITPPFAAMAFICSSFRVAPVRYKAVNRTVRSDDWFCRVLITSQKVRFRRGLHRSACPADSCVSPILYAECGKPFVRRLGLVVSSARWWPIPAQYCGQGRTWRPAYSESSLARSFSIM